MSGVCLGLVAGLNAEGLRGKFFGHTVSALFVSSEARGRVREELQVLGNKCTHERTIKEKAVSENWEVRKRAREVGGDFTSVKKGGWLSWEEVPGAQPGVALQPEGEGVPLRPWFLRWVCWCSPGRGTGLMGDF